VTFADYLHAHDVLLARRDHVEVELGRIAGASPWAGVIARLRCLRGIDTLSATGLCAEVGEFERFEHPDLLASYLGLTPSENSSGEKRRQGAITKAGSTHARRLLVESSYHYLRRPLVGADLERRQRGQAVAVVNIAWRAQRRLHARWRQLKHAAGNPTASSRSRSSANSPASAGRSRRSTDTPLGCRGGAAAPPLRAQHQSAKVL
jgi:transposase